MKTGILILLFISYSLQGLAQTRTLSPDQTASANALVGAFYSVLSGDNADQIRDLFHPEASLFRMEPADERGASARSIRRAEVMSSSYFYRESVNQQRVAARFHGFDDVAQIFSTFEWRDPATGQAEGRGIDSFQLAFDGHRWWVMSVVRQEETPEMTIPSYYLPSPVLSREDPPTIPLPEDLDRVLRDYEQLWQTGKGLELAQLFTVDGYVLPPGTPPRQGREAIARGYASVGGDLRLRAIDYAIEGSTGYIVGAYGYGEDGGDTGKWILTLRRDEEGRWLISGDMNNSSR